MAGEPILADRLAREIGGGRIEPHRLLEHGSRHRQTFGRVAVVGGVEMRVDLGLDAVAPVRRLRQQIERPGQRVGGGLVAGADEGDDVGAHVLFRQAAPGLRVGGAQQQRQQIFRRRRAGLRSARAAPATMSSTALGEEVRARPCRACGRCAAGNPARRARRAGRCGRWCRNSGSPPSGTGSPRARAPG